MTVNVIIINVVCSYGTIVIRYDFVTDQSCFNHVTLFSISSDSGAGVWELLKASLPEWKLPEFKSGEDSGTSSLVKG